MGFTNTYKILFEAKVLHHYFLNKGVDIFDSLNEADRILVLKDYDVREFISIEPTEACAKLLAKNHLIAKATPSGLIVGLQAQASGTDFKPVVSLDNDLRFTFLMQLADPLFSNYTSLPLQVDRSSGFYFQNRKTNSTKKFPSLARFAAKFANGQKYSAGEILSDNSNAPTQIFVAGAILNAAPPGAGWINDPLVGGKPSHYVTSNDLLPLYNDFLRYRTDKTNINPTVTVADRWGNTFNPPFEIMADNDKVVVLTDIHLLPEDLFTVTFEDVGQSYKEEVTFYRLQSSRADAILDLTITSDDAAYNMIDANNVLLSPVYELRFRNRNLVWQYNGEKFTSKPRTSSNPVTKFGFIDVTLKNDANVDVDLPNPDIRMVRIARPANDNEHYDLFTETYIH